MSSQESAENVSCSTDYGHWAQGQRRSRGLDRILAYSSESVVTSLWQNHPQPVILLSTSEEKEAQRARSTSTTPRSGKGLERFERDKLVGVPSVGSSSEDGVGKESVETTLIQYATVAGHFPSATAASVKAKPKKVNKVEVPTEEVKSETQANATGPITPQTQS